MLKAEKMDMALLEAKYGFVTPQTVLQSLQRDAIQGKADIFQEDIYEKPMVEVRYRIWGLCRTNTEQSRCDRCRAAPTAGQVGGEAEGDAPADAGAAADGGAVAQTGPVQA